LRNGRHCLIWPEKIPSLQFTQLGFAGDGRVNTAHSDARGRKTFYAQPHPARLVRPSSHRQFEGRDPGGRAEGSRRRVSRQAHRFKFLLGEVFSVSNNEGFHDLSKKKKGQSVAIDQGDLQKYGRGAASPEAR